jgi:hypothetical protein
MVELCDKKLTDEERQSLAKAWDEGWQAAFRYAYPDVGPGIKETNPYRK